MPDTLKYAASKIASASIHLRNLPQAMAMVWGAARYYAIAWIALLIAQGLLPVAVVYLTRLFVDSIVASRSAGGDWQSIRPALILAVVMGAVLLFMEILRVATGWIRAIQSELLKDHISALIHNKSTTVDLAFYEMPEYYDHLYRAREEAGYRPILLLESLGSLLQNSITLAAMGVVLLQFGVWLPVALMISTMPALYVVLRYTLRQHQWRLRVTPDERRAWYYDALVTGKEAASEIRLFDLGGHFQSIYQRLRERLRGEYIKLAKDQGVAELAAATTGLLITAAAMIWMVRRALLGIVTLGELALFYQAFNQGQRLMRSLLENVGQLYANSLFLGNLFEFLNLKARVVDPSETAPLDEVEGSICFRDVTFHYPGSERVALKDFNLTIAPGQIVAVVGANGAGKSTFIKLLCRLYDPDGGTIELDGIDLREMSLKDLRRQITVLFQEPVHYSATVAENIALGDESADARMDEIERAAKAAGADRIIRRLPDGYDNLLGKGFAGGAEFSAGEWQRIALARAFLRQAPIMIFDEPTSAMDSWAEAEWLARFRHLAVGRTVIMITHRFTTALRADVIHVMADGAIVESGSHQELLARGGLYAKSWAVQVGA